MENTPKSPQHYVKVMVDNPICMRRFHLCYEENHSQIMEEVNVTCPWCDVVIFSAKNHAPVVLAREENLIKMPHNGQRQMNQCEFHKFHS